MNQSVNPSKLISVVDTNGNYIYANDAYCDALQLSIDELNRTKARNLDHEVMPGSIKDEMAAAIRNGMSWQGVIAKRRQDGSPLWIDAFITPYFENGRVVGHQAISSLASASQESEAQRIYQRIKSGDKGVTFELTRRHKFALLTLISVLAQIYVFINFGLTASIVAALSAITPIVVFWQDIIPTAQKAAQMQSTFDSVSRLIYFGRGTASVFEFNMAMLKTKIKAILDRTLDATAPIQSVIDKVYQGTQRTQKNLFSQQQDLNGVSEAMSQMLLSTDEIAQSSLSTSDEINHTFAQCEQAKSGINETTAKIKQLAAEVEQASSAADKLNSEAHNVGSLMSDIQSIADQTNLLALNAAIEAARAGEHGRGFAVVAEEVRNLSSRTQESAVHIHSSLSAMLATIDEWLVMMNENKAAADNCVEHAEASDLAIASINDKMHELAKLTTQIATAAEEQSHVSREINQHVIDIKQQTEHNWEETEEVSGQMESLRTQISAISDLASTFIPKSK